MLGDLGAEDGAAVNSESRLVSLRRWMILHILHPVTEMEAGQVGNCVSIGLWGGIFPIPGATTFAVLILCWILPVHFSAAMQTVAVAMNVLITPVQWAVFPLFIIYGSYFLEDATCDPVTIIAHFTNPKVSFLDTLRDSSACIAGGCLVWTALGVPVVIVLSTIISFSVMFVRLRRGRPYTALCVVEKSGDNDVEMAPVVVSSPSFSQSNFSRGAEDRPSSSKYNNS